MDPLLEQWLIFGLVVLAIGVFAYTLNSLGKPLVAAKVEKFKAQAAMLDQERQERALQLDFDKQTAAARIELKNTELANQKLLADNEAQLIGDTYDDQVIAERIRLSGLAEAEVEHARNHPPLNSAALESVLETYMDYMRTIPIHRKQSFDEWWGNTDISSLTNPS